MVRHILFWTFSERVTNENRDSVLALITNSVNGLSGKIPGLLKAEIGVNFADSPCDFVFYAEFENKAAVPAFQNHPLHLKHKALCAPYVASRFAADYEI